MDGFEKYVAQYAEYLEDIRKRLFSTIIFFTIAFIAGFALTAPMVKFVTGFLGITDAELVATSPFQLIDLAMDTGFFFATVLTIPLLVYHLYQFLRRGLLPRERKIFFLLVPCALMLFMVGFSYGFITMYYAMHLVAAANVTLGVVNLWDISLFLSQMLMTSTLLGLLFEFPIIITFLIRADVMHVEFLRDKRRHAVVAIFIFVSLLPPTDGLSLLLMSVPLVAIYEFTILANAKKTGASKLAITT